MKKAVSLTELMIAISLMAVIILGAAVFDVTSHKFMSVSERRTALENDLGYVQDYFSKDAANAPALSAANGLTSASCGTNCTRIYMRHDTGTPANAADDVNIAYEFNSNNHTISRNGQVLTNRYVTPGSSLVYPSSGACLRVRPVILRYDPSASANNTTNPEIQGNIAGCSLGCAG